MDDFEVHPVGTVRGLLQCIAELEQRLIEAYSPPAIDENSPVFLKPQAD